MMGINRLWLLLIDGRSGGGRSGGGRLGGGRAGMLGLILDFRPGFEFWFSEGLGFDVRQPVRELNLNFE